MASSAYSLCFRLLLLLLTCALLGSCAGSPRRSGSLDGTLRLDSETVGRARYAASAKGAVGSATSSVVRATASNLARFVPEILRLFLNDETEIGRLEDFLLECVRRAEREVNSERFGSREPTSADCKAVVGVDKCGRPIYQSMELGNLKHAHALACMQDILRELWPGPVSIEQRYRYFRHAGIVELVSREEEKRHLDEDCTGELWRTIKPDVVLHADYNLLRAVLILDLKFPCPGGRDPKWTEYGDKSAYNGSDQREIYEEALDGAALILSPKGISQ